MSKRQSVIDRLIERLDYRIAALQAAREELLVETQPAAPKAGKKPRTLAAVAASETSK